MSVNSCHYWLCGNYAKMAVTECFPFNKSEWLFKKSTIAFSWSFVTE